MRYIYRQRFALSGVAVQAIRDGPGLAIVAGQKAQLADAAMLAAVDTYLVRGVGVAFQARRALAQQHAAERRARAIQARSSAQVDPPQRLCTGIAGLADQHAAALHQHPYFHEEVRRHGSTAQHKAQQHDQKALLHLMILVDVC
ncbi:hypothetical protein D9M71_625280 [compost metagenome]